MKARTIRMTGELAWALLGAGIIAYEIAAPEGQLLSEAVDRFLVSHPVTTRVVIIGLAAHLLNAIAPEYDPLHHTAILIRKGRVVIVDERRNHGKRELGEPR